MRGLQIEGGDPERCYVGEWVNGLWKDSYIDKKPGDTIEVQVNGKTETWDVIKAPQHWWDACWEESENQEREPFDSDMDTCDVYDLEPGDCIFDKIKIEDRQYPCMKWCVIKPHYKDADLLYIVPFFESDPYGNITDIDYDFEFREFMFGFEEEDEREGDYKPFGVFVEDTERQDHVYALTGNGTWIHRLDLLGVSRDFNRERIVEPVRKQLSEWVNSLCNSKS